MIKSDRFVLPDDPLAKAVSALQFMFVKEWLANCKRGDKIVEFHQKKKREAA